MSITYSTTSMLNFSALRSVDSDPFATLSRRATVRFLIGRELWPSLLDVEVLARRPGVDAVREVGLCEHLDVEVECVVGRHLADDPPVRQ